MSPRFVPRLLSGLVILFGVLLMGCASTDTSTSPTVTSTVLSDVSAPPWAGDLATVPASRLPAEARETLALIDDGGPFPYARDGAVFGNFERELPRQQRGYYHEFTVRTPGESDRGARRIVTGEGGEIYYTDDHYKSFRAVLR
ncbi:ribonuclease domain-containing protein [Streptomyces sp. NPDC050535]|uniref:ribonuclease domain-containing protein n=1 Tax=Streptomyces sp. NPDC050535 TaxID=3365626 RepID=UPI0037965B08